MRTTLTLDADIAAEAKRAVAATGLPFKAVVNQALRLGLRNLLEPGKSRPYQTEPRPMGLKTGLSYDNVSELLDVLEGDLQR